MDTYTFTAGANGIVLVRMSTTSGELDPYIRLYRPDGVKICEASSWGAAEITNCTLPVSGTYSILASDDYADETGGYNLYLECLNALCSSAITMLRNSAFVGSEELR